MAQLGCLAPGQVGEVVRVQSTKDLPLAVRSKATGVIWYYKAEELVLADAPPESAARVKPGTVGKSKSANLATSPQWLWR